MSTSSSTCSFPNARNQQLAARLERPTGEVLATAVFAHCFTCSKDLRAARTVQRALAARGIAVLSFDFAGLGSSDGEFAASRFSHDVEDLLAAAAYLGETIAPPTLLVGHSLGGAAVLTAAGRMDGIRAVATIGAPSDVEHVTGAIEGLDVDALGPDDRAEVTIGGRSFTVGGHFIHDLSHHRLLETVAELDQALLFLHAPLDRTVSVDHARALFEAARHPKSFVSLDSADHLLSDRADATYAAEVIASWAARYLPDAAVEGRPAGAWDDTTARATTGAGYATLLETRGFTLQIDEPVAVGGTETGPTPYEYLTGALAACTSMTLRMYADRKQIPLESVTTSVDFERIHATDCEECEHADGRLEVFRRHVDLVGDLDAEQRRALMRIADRCPVHRTLEGTIEVVTTP